MPTFAKHVVAIVGAGDLAKYLCEAFLASPHSPVLFSRTRKPWFVERKIPIETVTYTHDSILAALERTRATVLISVICSGDVEVTTSAQIAMLSACRASTLCKRMIPSDWGSNIVDWNTFPLFWPAHVPIREALARQTEVEYTLVQVGWRVCA